MEQNYQNKLERFTDNVHNVKKAFAWHNMLVTRLASLLYAERNLEADGEAIRESYELIKRSTGMFSQFRGNMAVCIAAMLSLAEDKQQRLQDTLQIYELLKEYKFRASDYLAVAAYQIAANAPDGQYRQAAERAKAFYDSMKSNHRFLTSHDDVIFAAMLALSDLDAEQSSARIEELYSRLKPEFLSGNSVQTLSHVLVLGEQHAGSPAERVLALRDVFRQKGLRMDREYTLPSLGVLSLLPSSDEAIALQVEETYEYLHTKKGFGSWSITKQELLLFAAALTATDQVEALANSSNLTAAALSTSISNIIIAQQVALAVIAATSAANAASSSSD